MSLFAYVFTRIRVFFDALSVLRMRVFCVYFGSLISELHCNVVHFLKNCVCGDYVILLVTFFIANQIVLQNISRTKILIDRSGKS